jgi:hypothetical protein
MLAGMNAIQGQQQSPLVQTQPVEPPKRKFGAVDAIGVLGDALQSFGGGQGSYVPMLLADQRRNQALQDTETQRQRDVADWLAKEQWKRNNPEPKRNDTIDDFNWYKGLSTEDRATYDQMHPVWRTGPDGLPYPMARSAMGGQAPQGELPSFTADDWDKAGGSAGNGTGGFR